MLKLIPMKLIVEDSPRGIEAALNSKAKLLIVENPDSVTYEKINNYMNQEDKPTTLKLSNFNILIPMAGEGSRFKEAGFTFPKPLIEVNGKPMIQVIIENLGFEANYIYVVRKEHYDKYNLKSFLNLITPNCKIIQVESLTEGAACTTLLAKEYINNDNPLIIANSDQFLEWNPIDFYYKMIETKADGGIVTFKATHPKWSFAKINELGNVIQVAEKDPISDMATVGIYYYKKGSEYVKYAEQMISKNIRTNNEFYVCPIFNEYIGDNKKIKTYGIEKMFGIGTPEDLQYFLNNYNQ
jgi:dTDP-glucose pyrophosphorylase